MKSNVVPLTTFTMSGNSTTTTKGKQRPPESAQIAGGQKAYRNTGFMKMMNSASIAMNKAMESAVLVGPSHSGGVFQQAKHAASKPPKGLKSTDARKKPSMRRSLLMGPSTDELAIDQNGKQRNKD